MGGRTDEDSPIAPFLVVTVTHPVDVVGAGAELAVGAVGSGVRVVEVTRSGLEEGRGVGRTGLSCSKLSVRIQGSAK